MCWRASLLYPPTLKPPVTSSLMKRGEQNKRNAMCKDMHPAAEESQCSTCLNMYVCMYMYIYYSCFTPALYIICMHNVFMIYMYAYIYTCIYAFLVLYSCFTYIQISLIYIHIQILFSPLFLLHIQCVYSMSIIYMYTDIDIQIDVCFTSALLLLHYCFISLYKFCAPAFTPAVLIYI